MADRAIPHVSDRTAYGQAVLRGRELAARGLKVCAKCRRELPIASFRVYHRACKTCEYHRDTATRAAGHTSHRAPQPRVPDRPYAGPVLVAGRAAGPWGPIAGLSVDEWPKHLRRYSDLAPIGVLTDEAVANGYAMADAAAPLPRGWTPAPVCVLRGDDGGGGA